MMKQKLPEYSNYANYFVLLQLLQIEEMTFQK